MNDNFRSSIKEEFGWLSWAVPTAVVVFLIVVLVWLMAQFSTQTKAITPALVRGEVQRALLFCATKEGVPACKWLFYIKASSISEDDQLWLSGLALGYKNNIPTEFEQIKVNGTECILFAFETHVDLYCKREPLETK